MLAALLLNLNGQSPPAQPNPQHWGRFPFVRRRHSSASTSAFIEEDIEEAEYIDPVVNLQSIDFDGVALDALEKVQVKLKAETFVDLEARQEERRRAQEEEEILMLWMED